MQVPSTAVSRQKDEDHVHRHPSTPLAATWLIALAVGLSGCGGASTASGDAPASTGSPADASSPSVTDTPSEAASPVQPDPRSPALTAFDAATVEQAMRLAREVAYTGMTDPALLTPKPSHSLDEYAVITKHMTPEALVLFRGSYDAAQRGVKEAEDSLTALAYSGSTAADRQFQSEVPITLKDTRFTMDPLVDVDKSEPKRPEIVVKGTIETGYVGTVQAERGVLRCSRQWTYSFAPTPDGDQPVALNDYSTTSKCADTLLPLG